MPTTTPDMIRNLPSSKDHHNQLRRIRRNDEQYPQFAEYTLWPVLVFTVGTLEQARMVAQALNGRIRNTICVHTPAVEDYYYVDEEHVK